MTKKRTTNAGGGKRPAHVLELLPSHPGFLLYPTRW